jgi:hypothetical protein
MLPDLTTPCKYHVRFSPYECLKNPEPRIYAQKSVVVFDQSHPSRHMCCFFFRFPVMLCSRNSHLMHHACAWPVSRIILLLLCFYVSYSEACVRVRMRNLSLNRLVRPADLPSCSSAAAAAVVGDAALSCWDCSLSWRRAAMRSSGGAVRRRVRSRRRDTRRRW